MIFILIENNRMRKKNKKKFKKNEIILCIKIFKI